MQKQIEIVGEKLRKMMPWISSNKLVNKNKINNIINDE